MGEEKEFTLRNKNSGVSTVAYAPLRYGASIVLPSPYKQSPRQVDPQHRHRDVGGDWQPLPPFNAAPAATFVLTTAGGPNAEQGQNSVRLPLVHGGFAVSFGESAKNDCLMSGYGRWRGRHCHTAKRLARLCLQVESDGQGQWQFRRRPPPPHSSPTPLPSMEQFYGCDPKTHWEPAMYKVDLCWAGSRGRAHTPKCSHANTTQVVDVVVRNSKDPFLVAEDLTYDTFDFGPTAGAQWVSGLGLIALGCLIVVAPLCFARHLKAQGSAEERESLAAERSAARRG